MHRLQLIHIWGMQSVSSTLILPLESCITSQDHVLGQAAIVGILGFTFASVTHLVPLLLHVFSSQLTFHLCFIIAHPEAALANS